MVLLDPFGLLGDGRQGRDRDLPSAVRARPQGPVGPLPGMTLGRPRDDPLPLQPLQHAHGQLDAVASAGRRPVAILAVGLGQLGPAQRRQERDGVPNLCDRRVPKALAREGRLRQPLYARVHGGPGTTHRPSRPASSAESTSPMEALAHSRRPRPAAATPSLSQTHSLHSRLQTLTHNQKPNSE